MNKKLVTASLIVLVVLVLSVMYVFGGLPTTNNQAVVIKSNTMNMKLQSPKGYDAALRKCVDAFMACVNKSVEGLGICLRDPVNQNEQGRNQCKLQHQDRFRQCAEVENKCINDSKGGKPTTNSSKTNLKIQ